MSLTTRGSPRTPIELVRYETHAANARTCYRNRGAVCIEKNQMLTGRRPYSGVVLSGVEQMEPQVTHRLPLVHVQAATAVQEVMLHHAQCRCTSVIASKFFITAVSQSISDKQCRLCALVHNCVDDSAVLARHMCGARFRHSHAAAACAIKTEAVSRASPMQTT